MSESVILCEGYYDRAFWAGWLLHLGCTDPGAPPPGTQRRRDVFDPWNTKVTGGQFAFRSRSGRFLRVVPCHGRQRVLPEARSRLNRRPTRALERLVVNVDADLSAAGVPTAATGLRSQDVEQYLRRHADPAATLNAAGEIVLDGGATVVSLIRWEATDPSTPGLPDEQTLERLACAVLVAAYPSRGPAIHGWLSSRPSPPSPDPKAWAWSYMAGWYASMGCESFYSQLWQEPGVLAELETRLRASGAWSVADALAS
jgi:hypothetical protein